LITYYVPFVISSANRVIHVARMTNQPDEAWMLQAGRSLLDSED